MGDKRCMFNVYQSMKYPYNEDLCMRVDVIDEYMSIVQQQRLVKSVEIENIKKCFKVQSS